MKEKLQTHLTTDLPQVSVGALGWGEEGGSISKER